VHASWAARHANADSYSGSQSNIASSHIYVHDIRVGRSLLCTAQVVPIDVALYLGRCVVPLHGTERGAVAWSNLCQSWSISGLQSHASELERQSQDCWEYLLGPRGLESFGCEFSPVQAPRFSIIAVQRYFSVVIYCPQYSPKQLDQALCLT
jgi:hypothetical protein